MAKSKAKRQREHLARNGRMNPETMRGSQPDFSTHVRKTPTKQERLDKSYNKHKRKY